MPQHPPIADALPALRAALADRRVAVLQAPPGAGKTTYVPLALLDEAWLSGGRIVMLEPRRLAARAAATYMARQLGERPGETVGYRVRRDTRVSAHTCIEVVTEGVLTRMIHADPSLDGIGLVIFDEFHERSIHADLGLALTLQTKAVLRDDLAILVMSATLDGVTVARLLGDAPVIVSEGRSFPVTTHYLPRRGEQRIETLVAATVREVITRDQGDVLVFLPGAGEIRRVATTLADDALPAGVSVIPLHGSLPGDQQDFAIAASPSGRRKVVLATSIAETSLTIEGVRIVIDAGLMRVPRFSPRSGMSRLETVRVTRASADQRRGRAGRVAPGIAYRLWAEHEQAQLVPFNRPEILETDLAPLVLALAEAGVTDPATLAWLDPPPAAAVAQARELLGQLGALGLDGRITPHGRRIAELPMHPRLAHMIVTAPQPLRALACDIAALLSERDVLRAAGRAPEADLRLRLAHVRDERGTRGTLQDMTVDRDAVRRVRDQSREWQKLFGEVGPNAGPRGRLRAHDGDIDHVGALLALAYPDRIAQRRTSDDGGATVLREAGRTTAASRRFLLRNGRGALLGDGEALSAEEFLAVAEVDDQRPESRILLAAPIERTDIEAVFAGDLCTIDVIAWEREARAVITRRRVILGALVLADSALPQPDPDAVLAALLGGLRDEGLRVLPWSDAASRLRERITFVSRIQSGWPDVSDDALARSLADWLGPHLLGVRRLSDLARVDLASALMGMLTWPQRATLDTLAPTHLTVPSGSRLPIDYADPDAPSIAVRLQEMFGAIDTPRVGGGRVALTVQLLSPAHRPVQVTRDLAGFWRTTYFDVRKDLRGRYPKHHWPDDPLTAEATSRAKRRGS